MQTPRKFPDSDLESDLLDHMVTIAEGTPHNPTLHYSSVAEFVLTHGAFHRPSGPISPYAVMGEPMKCFGNCASRAMKYPNSWIYCEGVGLIKGLIPINHAWLLDYLTGEVHDLTWNLGPTGTPVSSTGNATALPVCAWDDVAYYGVSFPHDLVARAYMATESASLINATSDGFPLLQHPFSIDQANETYKQLMIRKVNVKHSSCR